MIQVNWIKNKISEYEKIMANKNKKIDEIADIILQCGYETFVKNIDMDKFALIINLFDDNIKTNIYNSFNDRTKFWFKKRLKMLKKQY